MTQVLRCLFLAIPFLVASVPAGADAIADCDRMAGDPTVALADIPTEAGEVCAAAVEADDQTPRLMHEYARTLEKAGDLPAALRYYGWAAEDGYPPAALALARLDEVTNEAATLGSEGTKESDPLAAFVAEAGQAPGDLAQAVSQTITLLPTGAALRSPQDVLMLRRGSEADMAKLLAALIASSDPTAEPRFGRCSMTEGQAGEMATVVMGRPAQRAQSLRQSLAEAAAQPGLDPAIVKVIADLDRQWSAAINAGKAEASALAADIATSGVPMAPQGLDALAAVFQRQDRFVVEVNTADGWQAFDPVTGATFDPNACAKYVTARDLPADLSPQIHIVMTATEGAIDETPSDRVLMDETLPFDQTLVLAFGEAWSLYPPDTKRQSGAQAYTPVLVSGTEQRFGQTLVLPVAPSMPASFGTALGNRLGGVLDQLGADPENAGNTVVKKAPDRLRRLVLDISLAGVGAPAETQHVVLVERTDLSQPMVDFGAQYMDFLGLLTLLPIDGAARSDAAIPPDTGSSFSAAALARQLASTGLAMNGIEPLRQAIFADLSDAPPPLPQGVGLLMTRWQAMPPAGEGQVPGLRIRQQLLRPFEPVSAAEPDPATVAADWAVASVLAERLSLQIATPGTEAEMPTDDALTAWSVARAAGATQVVRDSKGVVGLSDGARTRVDAALMAGKVLLLPSGPLRPDHESGLAWWILSSDGATVEDQFADGSRQELAEEAEVDTQVACRSAGSYFSFGSAISRVASVLGIVFALAGGGGDMGKAVTKYATAVAKAQEATEKARKAAELASKACGGSGGPGP